MTLLVLDDLTKSFNTSGFASRNPPAVSNVTFRSSRAKRSALSVSPDPANRHCCE